MLTDSSDDPVVVGVDGSAAAARAAAWAAELAAGRRWPLRLVLITERRWEKARGVAPSEETSELVNPRVLSDVEARLQASSPGLAITSVARRGHAVGELVREASSGRMLVLGRRGADMKGATSGNPNTRSRSPRRLPAGRNAIPMWP